MFYLLISKNSIAKLDFVNYSWSYHMNIIVYLLTDKNVYFWAKKDSEKSET